MGTSLPPMPRYGVTVARRPIVFAGSNPLACHGLKSIGRVSDLVAAALGNWIAAVADHAPGTERLFPCIG